MSSASEFVVLTSDRHIPLFPLHYATVSNERLFSLVDLTILPESRSYSLVFSTFTIDILIIQRVALCKSLCTPAFQL